MWLSQLRNRLVIYEDEGLIPSLTQVGQGAMSCGLGCRHGLDPALLLLCCRPCCKPTAAAPIQSVAWELPYAVGVAVKRQKKSSLIIERLD